MKKLNWKQWAAIAITIVVIISTVVCHFLQPEISYALMEAVSLITFILGYVVGNLFKIEKKSDKKILLD